MMTGQHPQNPILSRSLNLGQLQQTLHRQLASRSESASSDVRLLLAHFIDRPTSWVLAHPEYTPTPRERRLLDEAAGELLTGRPLPYVIGEWPFFGLDFYVSPNALIPRPETELLVDEALAWLRRNPGRGRVLDVGTGTGCIAISIAAANPTVAVLGSDVSAPAIRLANKNGRRHQVHERTHWVQGDLIGWVRSGRIDLICANLPYIPSGRLAGLDVYGREPSLALDGGQDGLDLLRALLLSVRHTLSPGGALLAEIDAEQGVQIRAEVARIHPEAEAQVLSDLAGRDRLLRLQFPG